jgi:hypothetical protein
MRPCCGRSSLPMSSATKSLTSRPWALCHPGAVIRVAAREALDYSIANLAPTLTEGSDQVGARVTALIFEAAHRASLEETGRVTGVITRAIGPSVRDRVLQQTTGATFASTTSLGTELVLLLAGGELPTQVEITIRRLAALPWAWRRWRAMSAPLHHNVLVTW